MSEDDFLKRWSRRKREVAEAEKPPSPEMGAETHPPEHAVSGEADEKAEADFDPATLPPVESITSVTDITAFLRAGVPADLTRAALRRVWTMDPAIRDFVGLAENAWDFTDPNAMPGFGPLESTDEVRRMIARVIDSIGQAASPAADDAMPKDEEVSENSSDSSAINSANQSVSMPEQVASASDQTGQRAAEIASSQVLLQSNNEYIAVQRDVGEVADKSEQSSRRIHGGALPQ